ncbi:Os05g0153901, partial [Oryza sativa Japonica Group]
QSEEKVIRLSKEKDQLLKERDAALQEAHMWRTELGKAREQAVVQEATIARVDGMLRASEADAWVYCLHIAICYSAVVVPD